MLDNNEIYEQSLVDHLYYLRAIRSYCISIGLSFFGNNEEYINEAINLGIRAREIENLAISYTNNKVGKEISNSGFYVTPYTISCELLTEKLFGVSLNINIQENIKALSNKADFVVNSDMILKINNLNQQGLTLAHDFCSFSLMIREKLIKKELFSYLYPEFFNYTYDAVDIYVKDLERIIKKEDYAPIYLQNYAYYFNEAYKKTAKFLRGFLDTRHQDIFDMATFYVNSFANLVDKYLKEDNNDELSLQTENLVINYKDFISNTIQKLLNKEIYFITPANTIDHFLASTNVYLYIMNYIRKKPKSNQYLL